MEEKIMVLCPHEEPLHGLCLEQGVFHQNVLIWHIHKATCVLLDNIPHDSPLQVFVLQ
jgi:hypothetical protein